MKKQLAQKHKRSAEHSGSKSYLFSCNRNPLKTAAALLLMLVLAVSASAQDLIITAVMYDPPGTDSGREWIEIYNPTDELIPLKDYRIETGNGAEPDSWKIAVEGSEKIVFPKSHLLIGEELVSPKPDIITSLDLQNGPDACRISNASDAIDTLGWGDLEYDEYYEGTPATDPGDGKGLKRRYINASSEIAYLDTANNSADFIQTSALPESSAAASILMSVEITEPQQIMLSCSTEDDLDAEGIQISPYPGATRQLDLSCITDTCSINISVELEGRQLEYAIDTINSTHCRLEAGFSIGYSKPPGTYSLNISGDIERSIEIEVLALSALSIDTPGLSFGKLDPGEEMRIEGDLSMETKGAPTIMNIGNANLSLGAAGTDFHSSKGSFDAGLLSYIITLENGRTSEGQFSAGPATTGISLMPEEKAGITLLLDTPGSVSPGIYDAQAMFLASEP